MDIRKVLHEYSHLNSEYEIIKKETVDNSHITAVVYSL